MGYLWQYGCIARRNSLWWIWFTWHWGLDHMYMCFWKAWAFPLYFLPSFFKHFSFEHLQRWRHFKNSIFTVFACGWEKHFFFIKTDITSWNCAYSGCYFVLCSFLFNNVFVVLLHPHMKETECDWAELLLNPLLQRYKPRFWIRTGRTLWIRVEP